MIYHRTVHKCDETHTNSKWVGGGDIPSFNEEIQSLVKILREKVEKLIAQKTFELSN